MKTITRVLDVDSTLEGERVGMTIDTDALAHIMSVLTDLYSDPELAVIREYSTNAFDAHIEAGITRPIEVTLPSPLALFFKVRDFGYGLDADDIRDIYSRYGTSTKRNSDDVVGMLGLGCKSALSYTDQFTLRGIKNSVCTQVSVSRDEDGSGSMTILDQYPTEEESGVEIIVPVKRVNNFSNKAEKFFRFWQTNTVLVNGEQPKHIDGMWIADDLLLTQEVDKSYVVMGNVAYPFNEAQFNRWHTVAFVPIGAVSFTPSREALQMNAQTKNTLVYVQDRMNKEKETAIARLIDEAPNPQEAVKVAIDAQRIGYKQPPMYKGKPVPLATTRADGDTPFVVVHGQKYRRSKNWSKDKTLGATMWQKGFWLTGYESADFTAYKRQKIDQWLSEKGLSTPEFFILTKECPIPEWVDPATIHPWNEVAAQKIVRETQKRYDGRPTGSYEGYLATKWQSVIEAKDIDTTKPVFWLAKEWDYGSNRKIIDHNYPDATVVRLGLNRINKFKRDFPMAKEVREHSKELAEAWRNKLSSEQVVSIHLSTSGEIDELKHFDPELINDPQLKSIVSMSKVRDTILIGEHKLYNNWVTLPDWKNPFNEYKLLTSCSSYDIMKADFREHCYLYLNAVYAAKQEA